ncbi:MAG: hypothetical protein M0Z94_10625 [Dehalococcoidales bacterium]|nr:hypothetical protein [Dehalococcoidales bacterium]
MLGLPDYPLAVVEHPTGRLPDDLLKERAEKVLPTVVKQLTGGGRA